MSLLIQPQAIELVSVASMTTPQAEALFYVGNANQGVFLFVIANVQGSDATTRQLAMSYQNASGSYQSCTYVGGELPNNTSTQFSSVIDCKLNEQNIDAASSGLSGQMTFYPNNTGGISDPALCFGSCNYRTASPATYVSSWPAHFVPLYGLYVRFRMTVGNMISGSITQYLVRNS